MYTIYSDDTVIHNVMLKEDKQVVEHPVIEEEVNKAATLKFSMCPCHPSIDRIQKLKSIITVLEDDAEIFRGRVLESTDNYYKKRDVYCEGELSFLLDSVQRPFSYSGEIPQYMTRLLNAHNEQVDAEKRFYIGQVDVLGTVNVSESDYPATFDLLTSSLINTHGGYLKPRKAGNRRILDYLKVSSVNQSQVIRFEENILDLSRFINAADVYTAVIPLGAKLEGSDQYLTIASVNGGRDYLYNAEAVQKYGWIWKPVKYDVTVAEHLLQKGKEALQDGIMEATTIELTAFDLHIIHADIQRIQCGDVIRVVSDPHGIDTYMMVTKKTTDLENPANSKLTLGHACKCMTDL